MIAIFLLEIAVFGFLYFYTKGRYGGSVALFIAEKLIVGRFGNYERKLSAKLSELYGWRDVRCRLKLHLARKVIYMIAALLAVTALGAAMDEPDAGYLLFASAVLLAVFYAPDRDLDKRIKNRNFQIQRDFPDFLNKLVLLINAGMTIPRAWEKIVKDRKDLTPLYEELYATYLEIKNGKPETEAYEDFAKRCRTKEITKFVSIVIQNLKKGNSELVSLLKLQSNECWQARKNMAVRLGEEASTKLVFPLMIMFVGILVIVILPAVMQLKYL